MSHAGGEKTGMEIKEEVREDPENSDFIFVRCDACTKEHRIEKGDWLACPRDLEHGHSTSWYIVVYKNGDVKQTSHFKSIEVFVAFSVVRDTEDTLKQAGK